MNQNNPLPRYQEENLANFVWALRDSIFPVQGDAATYVGIHKSRVSRYETGDDKPPAGYIACLARQVVEQANDGPEAQEFLLHEVNRAARHARRPQSFKTWADLCHVADAYLNRNKRTAPSASPPPPTQPLSPAKRRAPFSTVWMQRLEAPTYSRLVGFDPHITRLVDVLTDQNAPWVVAIEGLGGLGKTSLAHAVVQEILGGQSFADFGWISAREDRFLPAGSVTTVEQPPINLDLLFDRLLAQLMGDLAPRSPLDRGSDPFTKLRLRLRQTPHLIVLDNLETIGELASLLPKLQELINPTKFLLTSRESIFDPAIFHFALSELNQEDALHLVRQEAAVQNFAALCAASDEELQPIYAVVGGNPLALRLVVGQAYRVGLDAILDELTQARGQKAEMLYQYIYRRAWQGLDETERRVLLSMPMTPYSGGDLEFLEFVTTLPSTELRQTLDHLIALNLVDSNHAAISARRRFTIHNLTRTFLQEEIAKWSG